MMNDNDFYNKRLLSNENYKIFLPDIPHIKRAQLSGEGFNNGLINKTLKECYPEIYESIQDESFFISDDEKYFYFVEILDENNENVIGFASFTIYNEKSLVLNQIYVLPNYRGQKHFVKVYNNISLLLPEAKILVKNPNHTIIKNIKDLNYCTVIKDRFLISNIIFITDQVSFDDALNLTNKKFVEQGSKALYSTESNLYDLKLDAVIKLSANNKIYTGKEDLMLVERSTISIVRDEDESKYNIISKRKEDPWIQKGNYFKKISKIFKKEMIKVDRK